MQCDKIIVWTGGLQKPLKISQALPCNTEEGELNRCLDPSRPSPAGQPHPCAQWELLAIPVVNTGLLYVGRESELVWASGAGCELSQLSVDPWESGPCVSLCSRPPDALQAFVLDFVFSKQRPGRQWSVSWGGLEPWLMRSPATSLPLLLRYLFPFSWYLRLCQPPYPCPYPPLAVASNPCMGLGVSVGGLCQAQSP